MSKLQRTVSQHWLRSVLIVLALLSLTEFMLRGVYRASHDSGDFATVYAASRAWSHRENPYQIGVIQREYLSGNGDPATIPDAQVTPSLYPPTAFVLVAPLAFFSFNVARLTLCALNVLATAALIWNLWAAIGQRIRITVNHRLFVATAVLAFAPLQTGISKGQLVACLAACVAYVFRVSLLPEERKSAVRAGVLLGIALCLKPQVAIGFLLVAIIYRNFRVVLSALAVLLATSCASLIVLLAVHQDWLSNWRSNIATANMGINSPELSNPARLQLINFDVISHTFFDNPQMAKAASLSVLLMLVFIVVALLSTRHGGRDLLRIQLFQITLGLLAIYHRFYDATFLIFLLLPVVIGLGQQARFYRFDVSISLIGLGVFLMPGALILSQLEPHLAPTLTHSIVWRGFLLLHQNWTILILCVIQLAALAFNKRNRADSEKPLES